VGRGKIRAVLSGEERSRDADPGEEEEIRFPSSASALARGRKRETTVTLTHGEVRKKGEGGGKERLEKKTLRTNAWIAGGKRAALFQRRKKEKGGD